MAQKAMQDNTKYIYLYNHELTYDIAKTLTSLTRVGRISDENNVYFI